LSKRQKNNRKSFQFEETADVIPFNPKFEKERRLPPIQPKTQKQADYLHAIKTNSQVVVLGPAGTGKTFIPATYAADQYREKRIRKIIITRPNVPAGRSLGAFPGELEDKFGRWLKQIITDIQSRMGKAAFEIAVKRGDIELIPFEVMRGQSWDNAVVILDEAQNTLVEEMKMFLTRQGENCTVVVNGDISQDDLRQKADSGLKVMVDLIRKYELPVPVIEFEIDDIVRSGECRMWVETFHREGL